LVSLPLPLTLTAPSGPPPPPFGRMLINSFNFGVFKIFIADF